MTLKQLAHLHLSKSDRSMKHSVETITPDSAADMLSMNTRNRRVVNSYVTQLAAAMKAGEFELNGETIKISETGVIIDGQHRLLACVKSGVPFQTIVVRGVKDDSFYTIDTGRKRTSADALSREGFQNVNILAGALRWIITINARGHRTRSIDLGPGKALSQIEKFPGLEDHVTFAHQITLMTPSMAAALSYLFSQKDHDASVAFFHDLRHGAGLCVGDPVLTLRNKLFDVKAAKTKIKSSIPQGEICAMVIRAWNARRAGRRLTLVKGLVTSESGSLMMPEIE